MIKQTLNIVPLINGLPIFLSELFYLKIKDHRKGEIHGSYQYFIYLSCNHLPS